jgi:glycosyltransferase involved in cell wall biosynthesis
MPAYNAENTLSDSIQSVIDQSYPNWELIIVNDGSTDNSLLIINNYQRIDSRIKAINLQTNNGLSNARNIGLLEAKGEFITFLDSDDLWYKNKLKFQHDFHLLNPNCQISHTNFNLIIENKIRPRRFRFFSELGYNYSGKLYPQLLYKNVIGVLTVCIKKQILDDVGLFDTNLWTFEDQDLWLRVSSVTEFGYINKALASYRINNNGITSKVGKYKLAYKEFIKKHWKCAEKNQLLDETFSVYNMYFGTQYYNSKKYFLSFLYFKKSLFLTKNYINKSIILIRLLLVSKEIAILEINKYLKW